MELPGNSADTAGAEGTAALATSILDEETRRIAEAALEAEQGREEVSDDKLVGVGDEQMSLRQVLKAGGVAPVAMVTLLTIFDSFDGAAFGVLGPEIRAALDLSDLTLALMGAMGGLILFIGAIPIGFLADRYRRWTIVGVCTTLGALAAASTALVQNSWQLVLARAGAGLPQAHQTPVHNALMADTYPPAGRGRIFALNQGSRPVSRLVGPLLAGTLAAWYGLDGWRNTFATLAVPGIVFGILALFMREPKRGRYEQQAALGSELVADEKVHIGVGAAFARLKKIRTFYFTMAALGALGFALVTIPIYMNLLLEARWGLGPAARGVISTVGATGSLIGATLGGIYGDRLFRRSPALSMGMAGAGIMVMGISLALEAYAPNPYVYLAISWVTAIPVGGAFIALSPVIAAVTPYRIRSTGYALIGLYLSLFGGVGGALTVGLLADSLGRQLAIAIIGPSAGLLGGGLLMYGGRFARGDMELAALEIIAEEEEKERVARGGDVALLQVRRLDYSYGPVQVLFDIELDVHEGEVLALLGTNGAGKSTLLRAISGLGYPDRGEVRLAGSTITYADAEERVKRGIVQVQGGKGVFPTLTVAENLSVGAYTFIWDRARVQRRAEEVLSLFPVLESRADQLAGSLSGGERQMLAICKGLMLEPKLLLLDELTMGLAPVVVQTILPTVERLKDEGMTIIIVEQSVNIALSLAERAVFMEKGRIRFEGPASELLERDDLVRAVFLGGEGG